MNIKSFLKCEAFWIFFLVFLLCLFSYGPIVRNFFVAPANRYYYGAGDYPLDMLGNLAVVREGYLGHWQRLSKVTSTIEGRPSLVKFEYILIGQVARFFRIDPLIVFYLARMAISIAFLWFLLFLITVLFSTKSKRLTAFAFSLFATGIVFPGQKSSILRQMISDFLVFQRLTVAAPHYLLAGLFAMLSLYFLAKTLDHSSLFLKGPSLSLLEGRAFITFLLALLFGFLSSFVFAPTMLLVIFSLPLYLLIRLIKWGFQKQWFWKSIRQAGILLVYTAVVTLPFFYLHYISQFWDFNTMAKTERIFTTDIGIVNYLLAVGATFALSIIAVPTILREERSIFLLFLPWIVVHPLSVLILAQMFNINKVRFFLTPYFLVFSVLATVGVIRLGSWIKIWLKKISHQLIYLLIVSLVLLTGWYALKLSIAFQEVCFCTKPFFGYPKKEVMEAIFWLADNTEEEEIVLSGYFVGNLIPAFAGNKVYTSWWFRLLEPPSLIENYQNWTRFYSGEMNKEETFGFVKSNKISYVFFGEEEKEVAKGKEGLSYPFLEERIKSNKTIVYSVEQSL